MKKDNNIIIRVDSELKENAMRIIRKEGFSLSDVLNASLKDIVHRGMIPMYISKYIGPRRTGPGYIDISFIKLCLEQIIEKHADKKIDKIYLFGSYARGEQNKSSDIDLRIETSEPIGLIKVGAIRQDLVECFGKEVDLLVSKPEEMDIEFYKNIRKDEICIYERQR